MPIAESLDIDAYGYFTYAFEHTPTKFYGTDLIFIITKSLRQYLYFNIFSMTFLFSFIGNIGILALASNIQNLAKDTRINIKFLFPKF